MKQRLTLHQLFQNSHVLRGGNKMRLHIGAFPYSGWQWAINHGYALCFHVRVKWA